MSKKPKFRPSTKIIMEGNASGYHVKSWFVIETRCQGIWMPVGDDKGMWKFATAEERDVKLKEMQSETEEAS